MCLILTAVAAAISAILWFTVFHDEKYNFQFLTLMYLGATLMWSVDGIFSVIEGEGFFDLSVDDAKLGVLVVILGVVLWAVTLIVRNVKTKSVKAL